MIMWRCLIKLMSMILRAVSVVITDLCIVSDLLHIMVKIIAKIKKFTFKGLK